MEPPGQKRLARIVLVLATALGLLWLARLDFSAKVSTNVLDLIPAEGESPELAIVRTLATEQQARVVLIALQFPAQPDLPPRAATDAFIHELRRSALFTQVAEAADPGARERIGRFVFERRFELLLPSWLAEQDRAFRASGRPKSEFPTWLADTAAGNLDRFVARPESLPFHDILPSDPLLLTAEVALRAQGLEMGAPANVALIWALAVPSPFELEGQQPIFTVLDAALNAARAAVPAVEMKWTSASRFAAESEARIRREVSALNTVSILAVLGVSAVFVIRLWKLLHLLPVILLSTLGAWVFATAVFDRIHVLVFVVGSLLSGVAVDYGFYLYMQPALTPDEPYRARLRRLLKPLLTSCLTTVIGFSFLLFSELPLIRQLGVFVSAGLVCALGAALLYFAQLDGAFLETRSFALPSQRNGRRILRLGFLVAALVALLGPWRLTWQDDVRDLQIPAPELQANDREVRRLFGDVQGRSVYLTRGPNASEARAALERFQAWHDGRFPDQDAVSLGLLLPTESDWLRLPTWQRALGDFPAALRASLEKRGYQADQFEPFFRAWTTAGAAGFSSYGELVAELRAQVSGPMGLLFHVGRDQAWFISLAAHAPGAEPPAELSTVPLSQLETLNALFSRYRDSALRLSAIGLGLVGASVFVLYGFRRGPRIFMIPAGSCFFVFGLFGLMGHTLNLFHLLGAFLGVCLSHNYAIFSAENAGRREPPPPSIRLSALTAAASFGVLAFSQIPVVAALGTTVALIVLTALLLVELEPLGVPADGRRQP